MSSASHSIGPVFPHERTISVHGVEHVCVPEYGEFDADEGIEWEVSRYASGRTADRDDSDADVWTTMRSYADGSTLEFDLQDKVRELVHGAFYHKNRIFYYEDEGIVCTPPDAAVLPTEVVEWMVVRQDFREHFDRGESWLPGSEGKLWGTVWSEADGSALESDIHRALQDEQDPLSAERVFQLGN